MLTLETLRFDNTYAHLPEVFHQTVFPTPFSKTHLVAFSRSAAALIDLDPAEADRPEFADRLSGALPLPGSWPIAQAYAGHQFSNYAPQLGDGRAILLGEAHGSRPHVWNRYRHLASDHWDLHLKGAGPTPFSRQFDGRAVLRSCIREFLASEALEALGIPTSRALAVIGSQDPVFRDTPEPGAMLLRMAPSHLRFGTFELFYHRKQYAELKLLADYAIAQFFPSLLNSETPYANLFQEVVLRTAELIAHWQAFGFTHGVMNTDNFALLGFTLDYGPFGFLEGFDPAYVSNHSDGTGLYAFGNQPQVGFFNLQCLMRALSPLLLQPQAEAALAEYEPALAGCYLGLMADKLGLMTRRDEDEALIGDLLTVLNGTDYSLFFRRLSGFRVQDNTLDLYFLKDICPNSAVLEPWLRTYRERLRAEGSDDPKRREHMDRVNPKYILRNYLAQQAIDAATQGDTEPLERLQRVLQNPFDEQPESNDLAISAPSWGKKLVISCSS